MSDAGMIGERDADRDGAAAVRLRIPAKAEYITLSRLALTGLAQLCDLGEDTLADLKLALTEAVSNSVRHAYGDGTDGHVDVSYEVRSGCFWIEVVDDGAGFDPERPPTLEGDELAEGGLGIAIIRTLADELEICSRLGTRGSRLRFAKRLP